MIIQVSLLFDRTDLVVLEKALTSLTQEDRPVSEIRERAARLLINVQHAREVASRVAAAHTSGIDVVLQRDL